MTDSDGSSSPPIDPAIAAKLLDLLSSDDAFRTAFEADPVSALASIGLDLGGKESARCMKVEVMASKEELLASKELLLKHLVSGAAFQNPHCFEANKIEGHLKSGG
ncbi:NHLP-related RiPP peptide [Xanthomonas sp. AmX2]|uniref:NHLP-related RiPP peptide n=1 Tax=Xanthomonas sp. TaxID=29446 RepID=UPI00197F76EC|nr:NHLP-related RiPP peptide [Xanthomonas sp.]